MMAEVNPRETPYKGLVPYAESDYPLFFGRDSERDIITANILGSRLTLVYGPSGVGKSSVLCAGVVHGIRKMAKEEVEANGNPSFVVAFFNQWRDEPLAGLRNEIRSSVQNAIGESPDIPSNLSFADELKHLAKVVNGKLLIILDQFEEYFLYPQKDGEGSFAYEFPIALSRSDVRANFIVSLREDWYTKLDRFKNAIPNLFDNNIRVDWLNREGARQAIEEPVRVHNEKHKNGTPEVKIKSGFAAEVIEQLEALTERNVVGDTVTGDAKVLKGRGSIQTPYLQLVMSQLWAEAIKQPVPELDPSMLKAPVSGEPGETRSEQIIQSHLDSMMKTLSAEEQEVAARAFNHLITPGGTKIAQQIGDLVYFTTFPESILTPVLEKLSCKEMSILTQLMPPPNKTSNEVRYELFHDVLAAAILSWRARFNSEQAEAKAKAEATQKLEQERAKAAKQAARKEAELREAHERAEMERQRAEDQKARVEAESRARMAEQERAEAEKLRADEQFQRVVEHIRTSKRLRWLSIGLTAMVLFSLAASVVAGVMWRRAKESEDRALAGQAQAESSAKIAQQNEERANRFAEESKTLRQQGAAAEEKASQMSVQAELNLRAAEQAKKIAAEARRRATVDRAAAQTAFAAADEARQIASNARIEAFKARQEAFKNQEIANKAQDLNVLYQNALVKYRSKDYQGTIETLNSALPYIETGSPDRAYALTLIGYSYSDSKRPTEAVDSYNKALEIFRAKQDVPGQLHTLRSLGDAYGSMEGAANKQEATRYYEEATLGYERNQAFEEAARVQLKVAKLYEDSDNNADKEKMIAAYRRAIATYQQAGKKELAAATLVNLGKSYVASADDNPSDADAAEAAYHQAVDIYKAKNDTENAVNTLTKIAQLFEDFEDQPKREKSYKAYADAAKLYEDANQDKEAGVTLSRLALVQREHDRLDLAQGNFEKAASAFERAGDLAGQARSLRGIALINNCPTCDDNKKRRAADLYRRSVGLYERMKTLSAADRRNLNLSLGSLVRIYTALGEKSLAEEYQKKLDALKKVPE